MNTPGLHSAALGALEQLINQALSLDTLTRERLSALEGHRFTLHCTRPAVSAVLVVNQGQLLLLTDSDGASTTSLTGSWDEFARIALAEDPAVALINGNVKVSGDTAPLLALRDILSGLDIDWEQPLSRFVGDVAAHQIGRGLRAGGHWAAETFRSVRRQLSEFVIEESDWVPHPIQVEDFYREVEELALRTERLDARLRQLKQRVAATPSADNHSADNH